MMVVNCNKSKIDLDKFHFVDKFILFLHDKKIYLIFQVEIKIYIDEP